MRNAARLLKLATDHWPPPGGRKHGLYLGDDGVLTLVLWLTDGTMQDIKLDGEGDLDLRPEDVISTTAMILTRGA